MFRAQLILLASLALTTPALASSGGSVQLGPNTIHGTVSFSNADPAARAILDLYGTGAPQVTVTSTAPTGYSTSTVGQQDTAAGVAPTSSSYSLQTEASGGVGRVVYCDLSVGTYYSLGFFVWDTQHGLVLELPDQQSSGLEADVSETVTVHRVNLCQSCADSTDGTCNHPAAPIADGEIYLHDDDGLLTYAELVDGTTYYAYQPVTGGNAGADIYMTIALSDGNRIVAHANATFSPAGDGVVDHCIEVPEGAGALGAIQTPFILEGYALTTATAGAVGPFNNQRYETIAANSTQDRSTWLYLPDLVPDPDWIYLEVYSILADHGAAQSSLDVVGPEHFGIEAGVTTDLARDFGDGVQREPFDMHPAVLTGTVHVADPYVLTHPEAITSLGALLFGLDEPDTDGSSPNFGDAVNGPAGGTCVTLQPPGTNGLNSVSFAERYAPGSGALRATYVLPAPLVYDQPAQWSPPQLTLFFASNPASQHHDWGQIFYAGMPTDANPAAFRVGQLTVQSLVDDPLALQAQQTTDEDISFCTNEVTLGFVATRNSDGSAGTFVNPQVNFSGGYQGIDFEGHAANQSVSGFAFGPPFVGHNLSGTTALPVRISNGSATFALPQGTFDLSPSVQYVDAAGNISASSYPDLSVTVGCGQRLSLVSGLSISLDAHTGCSTGGAAALSGTVSTGASISRIWYTVNGGPEIDICTGSSSCTSTFAAAAALTATSNSVTVYATADGISGSAQVSYFFTACEVPPPSCSGTSTAWLPGLGIFGMALFEDLFPFNGDLDFNDEALSYNYVFTLDGNQKVVQLEATYDALAVGAALHNGLYLHFPGIDPSAATGITLTKITAHGTTVTQPAFAANETDLVIPLTADTRTLFAAPVDPFINTTTDYAAEQGATLKLLVTFAENRGPLALPSALDLYLARQSPYDHTLELQIHQPEFTGTDKMDPTVFHHGQDGSDLSAGGLRFINSSGLPFALDVPALIPWMQETVDISVGYPDIIGFAIGHGDVAWYDSPDTLSGALFTQGSSGTAPGPRALVTSIQACQP